MHISWARLASFCHLGFISDPLIVSKFHNETHDPKLNSDQLNTHSTPVGMPDVFDRLTSANKSEKNISNLSSGQPRIPATVTHSLTDESVSSLSPKSTHSYQKPSYGPSGRDNYTDLEFI